MKKIQMRTEIIYSELAKEKSQPQSFVLGRNSKASGEWESLKGVL